MNVSLSPNDTLGRMLHTFNATAYEVAECNADNLKKYGLIKDSSLDSENIGLIFSLVDSEGNYLLDKNNNYLIPAGVLS
jgi:hypothetical protein